MPNIKKSDPRLRVLLYALRGALCYGFYVAVLMLSEFLFVNSFKPDELTFMFLEDYVYVAVRVAVVPFLFYSVSRAFALSDGYGYEQTATIDEQGYAVRWRDVIGSPMFLLQVLATLVLYAAVPLQWGFMSLLSLLPFELPTNEWLLKGMLAPLLIVFIGLTALAHRSARHEWQRIRHRRSDSSYRIRPHKGLVAFFKNETGIGGLLASLLLIAILYSIGALVAFAVLVILLPLLKLALQYWYVTLIVLIAILLPEYIISYRKRRKLIVGLRRVCERQGYTLSRIRTPYLSLLFDRKGADFTVKANDKTYECKLLTHHAFPTMRFDYNGTLSLVLSLNFRFLSRGRAFARAHEMGFEAFKRKICYAFESEHSKILIVCPVPAHTLIAGPNGGTPLDTGAHIGDYRMFNTTGFLGALERDCLDR